MTKTNQCSLHGDHTSGRNNFRITRRTAITQLAAGSTFGALVVTGLAQDSAVASPFALDNATIEEWQQLLGERFDLVGPVYERSEQTSAALTLEQVIENDWISRMDPNRPSQLRRASISLLFSADKRLANACYRWKDDRFGDSIMYLQQVLRDDLTDKLIYEVVLN